MHDFYIDNCEELAREMGNAEIHGDTACRFSPKLF